MFGMSRYPISFWFVFSLIIAYAFYNPWFSVIDFFRMDVFWGYKLIVGGFFGAILALYATEGGKAFSFIGFIILICLIGAVLITLVHSNWLSLGSAKYWAQIPTAIIMTVALRGASVYRIITGRVPTGTIVDHDEGDVSHHG